MTAYFHLCYNDHLSKKFKQLEKFLFLFKYSVFFLLTLINSCFSSEINIIKPEINTLLQGQPIKSLEKNKGGFLWIATDSEIWRFNGYKLDKLSSLSSDSPLMKNSKKLHIDNSSNLWIGTQDDGLFLYSNNKFKNFSTASQGSKTLKTNLISEVTSDKNNYLWIGTDVGLHLLKPDYSIEYFPFPEEYKTIDDKYITSISNYSEKQLILSTRNHLFNFDKDKHIFEKINLVDKELKMYIFNVYKDFQDNIWISTNKGIFLKKENSKNFNKFMPKEIKFSVVSVAVDKKNIWIGSFSNGIYKVSFDNETVRNYKHNENNISSLSGNLIYSLLLDDAGILWISTFANGINYIDTKTLDFGWKNKSQYSLLCVKSSWFNGFLEEENKIWLSSNKGLIEINKQNGVCKNLKEDTSFNSFLKDSDNDLWIGTTKGLDLIDINSGEIIEKVKIGYGVRFIIEQGIDTLYLGGLRGLLKYNKRDNVSTKISTLGLEPDTTFYDYTLNSNLSLFFATSSGVAFLNNSKQVVLYDNIQSQLPTKEIFSIQSLNNQLLVGTFQHGLYLFDESNKLIKHYNNPNKTNDLSIKSMLLDNSNTMWAGTNHGLLNIDFNTDKIHMYNKDNGLQGDNFEIGSAYKSKSGKLYFGGQNGFNSFYPEDIKINKIPPKIVLSDFTRFGKSVKLGVKHDDFVLEMPINDLQELELSHKDYIIGFEFAALDFAAPERNKYTYKLEGFDPDWTYVSADDRKATYTNLPSGNYSFRVKGSNKDGVWNEVGKSLNIKVFPAPWFSWWAFTLYIVTFFGLLFLYLYRKNLTNIKITNMLKTKVKERTQELQVQKQKVEILLVRKNKMFANVSHEFRTPLTLILGPVNNLLNSNLKSQDINSLKMVNRNANRLLTMIEQLLLLAKLSDEEKVEHVPQLIHKQVLSIYEIFLPLAKEKNIEFDLQNNNIATIKVVANTIDTVIGNLISNALKYTQIGGKVILNSYTKDNKVIIEVTDTGCGLDKQQQKKIFNRFTRLDSHANIDGVGIGLSVVEEMIKINNAKLKVESELGKGSTFTVEFDTTNELVKDTEEADYRFANQLAKYSILEAGNAKQFIQAVGSKTNDTILIIEDNDDMRAHIAESLKDNFHCLLTEGGRKGIALAIKHVPDIILCDVMMPEMDGFKVSRIIRSDSRTSHIPLILLTALHDKKSRIKGWREHIDAYLTKPFDAQELLLQLSNILVIRNILKSKASKNIKAGSKLTEETGLAKIDQEFINKLNNVIAKNYQNPNLQRPQIASAMAVSTKQLQRKLKALIDKNPMDLLREYRLMKAAEFLKDGYQVSIISDECGFNSLSHFSQCFKAQYGLSPKQYQQL